MTGEELNYLPSSPRRCRRCSYVLEYLSSPGDCPECGLPFDLANPVLFTLRPPYVGWLFWLPGFLTAFISAAMLYVILVPMIGWGWSTTFAVPLVAGSVLGYRVPVGVILNICLGVILLIALMITLSLFRFTGGLCVLVLAVLAIGPFLLGLIVGMYLGVIVRTTLKWTRFSQRHYLPAILIGLVLLLGAFEGRHRGMAIVSTSTVAVINASPEQTWRAIQFYEQVKHRPPLLLWVSPSLRPQYTTGNSGKVGDRKVCVYARGRLVKEITEVITGKRLAFRVVEQTEIENDGVRLVDGSFDLTPAPDGHGTVVTLTTRYEPKLAPRFAYLPAEDLAVHTLHGHVLRGMKEDAEQRQSHPPAATQP